VLSAFGAESAWTTGPLEFGATRLQALRKLVAATAPLKADQMGSEHPLDELSSPRQLRKYFVSGARDVVEGPIRTPGRRLRRPDGTNCSR